MKIIIHSAIIFITIMLVFSETTASNRCKAGNKEIHFVVNENLQTFVPNDFIPSFHEELENSLKEIGYCLFAIDSQILNDSTKRDDLILYMTSDSNYETDSSGEQNLIICLLRIEDWAKGNTAVSLEHPLISITYQPEEANTFKSVLIRKIVENIRTQYVCHLRIQSNPSGILITTTNGLEGKTPLEWILPTGTITVSSKTDKYEPFQKKINIDEPGIHTYFLELKKKQFYNSKFILPTIFFALASAGCYGAERYYYSKYLKLGEYEYYNNPSKFDKTYNTALKYEQASLISLGCAALTLTCAFIFK